MKDRLRKLIPSRNKLREFSALRPVAHLLNHPELWHLNRRGVSGAAFVGLFSAFIPVPSQMLLAAIIAIYVRVNLPISVALVWITNPITIPPMIYGSYRVGAWVNSPQGFKSNICTLNDFRNCRWRDKMLVEILRDFVRDGGLKRCLTTIRVVRQ